jgi:MFS family permease
MVVGLVNGWFWSLDPVFAQGKSVESDTTAIAIFVITAVIAGAIGQWPLGQLSDKIDRRKVIVAACLGAAIAMNLFLDEWSQAIFSFSILFGIFAFPLYALCAAHMNDSVEPGGFVEASSGLLLLC